MPLSMNEVLVCAKADHMSVRSSSSCSNIKLTRADQRSQGKEAFEDRHRSKTCCVVRSSASYISISRAKPVPYAKIDDVSKLE